MLLNYNWIFNELEKKTQRNWTTHKFYAADKNLISYFNVQVIQTVWFLSHLNTHSLFSEYVVMILIIV